MVNGNIDTKVKIGDLILKNPIIPASGTFGFATEFDEFFDINKLGAFVTKGLTLNPKKGNILPRIAEAEGGMLNSIGLENPGVEAFVQNIYPKIRKYDTKIIANISGNTIEEYGEIASILKGSVDAIEINVSCPNVKMGGLNFGTDISQVGIITELVKSKFEKTVIVKLTPSAGNIVEIAKSAENSGADAVSMINTFPGMLINTKTRKPILGNNIGGVSGPILKPMALKMIWDTYSKIKIPIIGMGGIGSIEDVIEFMIAGATAVSIGTMNLIQPDICSRLVDELNSYMKINNIERLSSISGSLILN